MKNILRAVVTLEIVNPKSHEAKFPSGKGLALGENIEECIAEAKSIYNDGYTRAISIEVFVNENIRIINIG